MILYIIAPIALFILIMAFIMLSADKTRGNKQNDETEKTVACFECGAKNRIRTHSDSMRPICGKCKTQLLPYSKTVKPQEPVRLSGVIICTCLLAAIVGVGYAMTVTPRIMAKDHSGIIASEEEKTALLKQQQEKKNAEIEIKLQKELSEIDADELRQKAILSYQSIINARNSFDKRYALTSREKSQLEMKKLAGDSTKTYHQALTDVARMASPKGADIRISETSNETSLHIDFDMSSMTSGERGTSTKHHTVESLKKEVISLTSRVTNDVFGFFMDLQLDTIHVGCRHHVTMNYPDGSKKVENSMLYKTQIKKSEAGRLSSNPFLDVYSTTKHLRVEEDNFSGIEIYTERR